METGEASCCTFSAHYLLQEAEAHLADVNQRFSAQFEIVRDLMSECDRKNTEQVMTKHTLGRTVSPISNLASFIIHWRHITITF